MNGNWTTIGNAIVSIINTLSTKPASVYNYEEAKPSAYPAITVTAHQGDGLFEDTARDRRHYSFRILVMQERPNVGASEAERITRAIVDELTTVFDAPAQTTLGNTVIFNAPASITWGYLQGTDVDVRSCELIITATDIR